MQKFQSEKEICVDYDDHTLQIWEKIITPFLVLYV